MNATQLHTLLLVSFLFSATASAQVFDRGPSDSELFTDVINVPGGVLPDMIGGVAGETIQVNVAAGGVVADNFTAIDGSEINISGGMVGDFFEIENGEVNISGGTVGEEFDVRGSSVVNLSGGSVGENFDIFGGSVINISGGSVGDNFDAFDGSEVNLFGSDFVLGGVPLTDLATGEAFPIDDRDVTLTGLLEDGSAFSFDLNSNFSFPAGDFFEDQFFPGSTLTVTLAPTTTTSVPEPTSVAILLLGCGLIGMRRRR